jgi:D-glycero-D-manno-heptose 1,7-bisphosphate phosphatase
MTRIILLDRDGVINQDSLNYIKSVDECIFIPGSLESIARLTQAGFKIGVATNQSGVSRGLYTEPELAVIHNQLMDKLHDAGGRIDALEYCIHLPEEGCTCRKPQPGMLFALAKRFNSTLKHVPFVGDRISDIQAATAAGADPVVVLSPMTDLEELFTYPDVPVYQSLKEYVDQLLENL